MDIKIRFEIIDEPPTRQWDKPPDPFGEKLCPERVDRRRAECPNCNRALKKIPAAKTKCPHCGEFMFVRTRPEDSARVVVTGAEADRIDTEYNMLSLAGDPDFRNITTESEVIAERERLREILSTKMCKEPADDDVKWALLGKKRAQHASKGDWGLYRNICLLMANFLTRRMKLKDALQLYLEVCTLDLNGPTNSNALKGPELLDEFPPFDLRQAFTAPMVIGQVDFVASKLGMSKQQLRELFMTQHPAYISMLPLSLENCWAKLEVAVNRV